MAQAAPTPRAGKAKRRTADKAAAGPRPEPTLTIVDGAGSETDAWEVRGHRPLMISNVVLHSLPAGYRFDLRRRHRLAGPALRALPGAEAASS